MTTETSAATVVDSAPTQAAAATPEQMSEFMRTGEIPTLPKKQDSAPAKKESAVADSAPQKDNAASSDSATDKDSQPHIKTKEDTERRFKEILNENKSLKDRLDALEKASKPSEKREPASQPAPKDEAPGPLKQFLEKYFADEKNKGKAYEEGVEAWQEARDKVREKQTEDRIRRELAQESERGKLQAQWKDAETRYGKEEAQKIFPALETILKDEQVPYAVKAMLNRSDVLVDLLYALGKETVAKFTDLAKSDPGAAIEKLVELQSDVRKALKAKSETKSDEKKDQVKTEAEPEAVKEKPRVPPKPPAEVGGRGATTESPDKAAARSGDFRSFGAEMKRRYSQPSS